MIARPLVLIGVVALGQAGCSSSLERQIDARIASSRADVAVAFETLDGRDRLLIKPDESFHAASTMKIPVMIELFRQAHAGLLPLDDTVAVVNDFHSIADGSPFKLTLDEADQQMVETSGGRATYRALCEAMITRSSNLAANVLLERLTPARVQATVDGLGAGGMRVLRGVGDDKAFDKGLNSTTTARALMTLLVRLAHGEVVDAASSAAMIDLLAQQQLNDGIPAGLPAGTRVAHKTGEITRINHDAAVVYGPRPFVLVVLVRGIDDQKVSNALIADVARLVYASVNR